MRLTTRAKEENEFPSAQSAVRAFEQIPGALRISLIANLSRPSPQQHTKLSATSPQLTERSVATAILCGELHSNALAFINLVFVSSPYQRTIETHQAYSVHSAKSTSTSRGRGSWSIRPTAGQQISRRVQTHLSYKYRTSLDRPKSAD